MGPLQRNASPAPTAFSQDPPRLRRRERSSLVKNRMREIRTSGTVRGGAGNDPTYSAVAIAYRSGLRIDPHRALRSAVGGMATGATDKAHDRTDVDDRAATGLGHLL